MSRRFRVRASVYVDIEVPDAGPNGEADPWFRIEENSCPGTHGAGEAIDMVRDAAEVAGHCWACNLGGENKIVAELDEHGNVIREYE